MTELGYRERRNRVRRSTFLLLAALFFGGSALAQQVDYQGPTILSRGVGPVLQGGGELVRLRPFLSLMGSYDTGLTPVSVDAEGNTIEQNSYGVNANFGVVGYHTWRHTVLGVDYRGDVRHYARNTYYDGTNHNLSLGVTHQPSRSLVFSFREAAGTYSRSYGLLTAGGFYDPVFSGAPNNELFEGAAALLQYRQ
jgi:hypothetical protein